MGLGCTTSVPSIPSSGLKQVCDWRADVQTILPTVLTIVVARNFQPTDNLLSTSENRAVHLNEVDVSSIVARPYFAHFIMSLCKVESFDSSA